MSPTKEIGKRSIMAVSNYRHKKILEMVYQRKSVSADELAAEFGVSKITIRRDLDTLAMDKLLERTRGGAISISDLGFEEIFEAKDHTAKKEKTLIGKYVASLITEDETVFLNAGSTTLEVMRHLKGKKVRVVTNNAASLLLDLDPGIDLILLGVMIQGKVAPEFAVTLALANPLQVFRTAALALFDPQLIVLGPSAYVILDLFGTTGYKIFALAYPATLGIVSATIGYFIFRRGDLP